jgi:hypothetical protein
MRRGLGWGRQTGACEIVVGDCIRDLEGLSACAAIATPWKEVAYNGRVFVHLPQEFS